MKIGIIEGSVRQGRNSTAVAKWVLENAPQVDGVEYSYIDLASFELPIFDLAGIPMMMDKKYPNPAVQAWSNAIDECDGFVFVTPEYNFGVPGAFKNAVDWLSPEWLNKPVGCVGYGSEGAQRAVADWRGILSNFNMHVVRQQVSIPVFSAVVDGVVQADDYKKQNLAVMFEQLIAAVALRQK